MLVTRHELHVELLFDAAPCPFSPGLFVFWPHLIKTEAKFLSPSAPFVPKPRGFLSEHSEWVPPEPLPAGTSPLLLFSAEFAN